MKHTLIEAKDLLTREVVQYEWEPDGSLYHLYGEGRERGFVNHYSSIEQVKEFLRYRGLELQETVC